MRGNLYLQCCCLNTSPAPSAQKKVISSSLSAQKFFYELMFTSFCFCNLAPSNCQDSVERQSSTSVSYMHVMKKNRDTNCICSGLIPTQIMLSLQITSIQCYHVALFSNVCPVSKQPKMELPVGEQLEQHGRCYHPALYK